MMCGHNQYVHRPLLMKMTPAVMTIVVLDTDNNIEEDIMMMMIDYVT